MSKCRLCSDIQRSARQFPFTSACSQADLFLSANNGCLAYFFLLEELRRFEPKFKRLGGHDRVYVWDGRAVKMEIFSAGALSLRLEFFAAKAKTSPLEESRMLPIIPGTQASASMNFSITNTITVESITNVVRCRGLCHSGVNNIYETRFYSNFCLRCNRETSLPVSSSSSRRLLSVHCTAVFASLSRLPKKQEKQQDDICSWRNLQEKKNLHMDNRMVARDGRQYTTRTMTTGVGMWRLRKNKRSDRRIEPNQSSRGSPFGLKQEKKQGPREKEGGIVDVSTGKKR